MSPYFESGQLPVTGFTSPMAFRRTQTSYPLYVPLCHTRHSQAAPVLEAHARNGNGYRDTGGNGWETMGKGDPAVNLFRGSGHY